jgi:hypothetical protein
MDALLTQSQIAQHMVIAQSDHVILD